MARVNSPIPVRKLAAASDVYARGFHEGNPAGLDGVDADLAADNIADGVTIFGKLGTFVGVLVEDVVGFDLPSTAAGTSGTYYRIGPAIAPTEDVTLNSLTQTYAALSRAIGTVVAYGKASDTNKLKLRLFMGGVQVAESSAFAATNTEFKVVQGTRALSGSVECTAVIHNYDASITRYLYTIVSTPNASPYGVILTVGSIKI